MRLKSTGLLLVLFSVFVSASAQSNDLAQKQSSSANVHGDHTPRRNDPTLIDYSLRVNPSFPDLLVRNQYGDKLRFYSDLIKGKVVVLSFFYSGCQYLCQRQGDVLGKLQARLGNRLGKEVFLISVTRDPATDTPARLKIWSEKFKVKPGWTLVTGEVREISKLLGAFVGDRPGRPELHSLDVWIGNDKEQNWVITPGVSDPEPLLEVIDRIAMKADARRGIGNADVP